MTRQFLWRATQFMTLIAFTLMAMLGGLFLRTHYERRSIPHLTVQFIDVGDGDCALIITPEKRTILIDTGGSNAAARVARALHHHAIDSIDLLILASPRESSIGGVEKLINSSITIRSAWRNSVRAMHTDNALQDSVLLALRKHGVPVRHAPHDRIALDGSPMSLTVLWPPDRDPRSRIDALVCRIDYLEDSFLFGGPSPVESEPYWISGAGPRLHCDVLHVPDQGAEGAVLPELIRQAEPSVTVISCSADKPPAPGSLRTLRAAGAALYRTDLQGNVTVLADGRNPLTVTSEKQ